MPPVFRRRAVSRSHQPQGQHRRAPSPCHTFYGPAGHGQPAGCAATLPKPPPGHGTYARTLAGRVGEAMSAGADLQLPVLELPANQLRSAPPQPLARSQIDSLIIGGQPAPKRARYPALGYSGRMRLPAGLLPLNRRQADGFCRCVMGAARACVHCVCPPPRLLEPRPRRSHAGGARMQAPSARGAGELRQRAWRQEWMS
jgi:hypothetical protein